MSPGKKTKKQKGKTVGLSSFLNETNTGATYVQKPIINWAQEVEDDQEGYMSSRSKEAVVLPTAPRAARDPGIVEENIPTSPPYVAYVSNLSYEVDSDELTEFFENLKISHMRLPKEANKFKGYGYVEFEDRQSLIDALSMTHSNIRNRRVRIEVSNSNNDDRRGGRLGRDNRRENYDNPDRTSGDWRSGPREESSSESDSYRNRYDRRPERNVSSNYDNKREGWRDRENNDGARSAYRSFRDDDRDRDRYYDRGSNDRNGDQGGSYGLRRNYDDRRDISRSDNKADEGMDSKTEPRVRPKLNLQPRTKPVEPLKVESDEGNKQKSVEETKAPSAPMANIFGNAKPVDTTAREREIEERLAKAAEAKSKEEGDLDKRSTSTKEGSERTLRRDGEGRDEREKPRPTWRTEDDRSRNTERSTSRSQQSSMRSIDQSRGDSKGRPFSRTGPTISKGPVRSNENRGHSDRDRREKDKDDISKMPKAKEEQAPNFVASNKYSMLPDDVDYNIDD